MSELSRIIAARVAAVSAANYDPDPDDTRAGALSYTGPRGQIYAAFRYIKERYGDCEPSPGYRFGGFVPQPQPWRYQP